MEQELLYKYFKGTTSEEEERLILDWVDASPENRKAFQKERMLYDIALFTDEKQMNRKDRKARIIPMLRWSARIAAVVIVAISFGFLFKNYQYEKSACQQTITVPAGQRAQITLADGTKVWLNSKSTLTYASNFGRKERNVELDGEAYFEVAKDKDKPFIVKTKEQSIEALGTKFNVSAYPTDSLLTTTLLEGSVLLTTQNLLHPMVLKPNEQFVYNKRTRSALLQQVDANRFVSWTTGYYYFPEQSLEAILYRLSHVYGVQFTVKSEALKRRTFTGTFYRGQSIKDIMEIIHLSIPVRYKIDDHHVTISEI